MRILHADTDDLDNPLRGGQPVRTYEINARLAARHDITVFTSVYKGCRRRMVRNNIRYQRLGFRLPPTGLSPHISFCASLGPRIFRTPHDLVVEEFTPPFGFCMLPLWTRKPVICMVQWFYFNEWHARYHLPFERAMRFLAARNRYRYFIVQTETMAQRFQALVPDALIRKIPGGLNPQAFLKPSGPGEYVLFLGRLDEKGKGLDLLFEAWRQHCAARQIPLVLSGDGRDRAILERHAAEKGISHLVRFTGFVDGWAKESVLQRCRFAITPSRSETFGIAALEGMAAGKAGIIFNIENLNELVRPPWGVQVPCFDTDCLGREIVALWDHPEKSYEMGLSAQQEALRYNWDRLAVDQEQFYLEVMDQQARPQA